MAQEEFAITSLQLENDRLRREVEDLKELMRLVKENLQLRSMLQSFSSGRDGWQHEFSGSDPAILRHPVDESEFRGGLVTPGRTSSPLSLSYDRGTQTASCQSPEDPGRLLGEIGFQLDRRIISYVFYDQTRLYGFTVQNLPHKIVEVSTHSLTGRVDEGYRRRLTDRHASLMEQLGSLGYNQTLHPPFTEFVVNTYGIMQQRPDARSGQDQDYLRHIVVEMAPPRLLKDLLLLLDCLCYMAQQDGQPLLLW